MGALPRTVSFESYSPFPSGIASPLQRGSGFLVSFYLCDWLVDVDSGLAVGEALAGDGDFGAATALVRLDANRSDDGSNVHAINVGAGSRVGLVADLDRLDPSLGRVGDASLVRNPNGSRFLCDYGGSASVVEPRFMDSAVGLSPSGSRSGKTKVILLSEMEMSEGLSLVPSVP